MSLVFSVRKADRLPEIGHAAGFVARIHAGPIADPFGISVILLPLRAETSSRIPKRNPGDREPMGQEIGFCTSRAEVQ